METIMNPSQILKLQNFIRLAHNDITLHKLHRDHASQRIMMYSCGRAIGAFEMLDDKTGDICAKRNNLEDCYHDAMGLTLH